MSARKLALVAVVVALTSLASGCAHRPTRSSGVGLDEIERETRAALMAQLKARPGIRTIREVKVSDARRESDGTIRLVYRLAYESDSQASGQVGHLVEATAVLEPARQGGGWVLTRSEPQASALVFETPVTINGEPRERMPAEVETR